MLALTYIIIICKLISIQMDYQTSLEQLIRICTKEMAILQISVVENC